MEFTIQLSNGLALSLSNTGGYMNNFPGNILATVLCFPTGAIHSLLGDSDTIEFLPYFKNMAILGGGVKMTLVVSSDP